MSELDELAAAARGSRNQTGTVRSKKSSTWLIGITLVLIAGGVVAYRIVRPGTNSSLPLGEGNGSVRAATTYSFTVASDRHEGWDKTPEGYWYKYDRFNKTGAIECEVALSEGKATIRADFSGDHIPAPAPKSAMMGQVGDRPHQHVTVRFDFGCESMLIDVAQPTVPSGFRALAALATARIIELRRADGREVHVTPEGIATIRRFSTYIRAGERSDSIFP
jgi:hypothetical protein